MRLIRHLKITHCDSTHYKKKPENLYKIFDIEQKEFTKCNILLKKSPKTQNRMTLPELNNGHLL